MRNALVFVVVVADVVIFGVIVVVVAFFNRLDFEVVFGGGCRRDPVLLMADSDLMKQGWEKNCLTF